jgi:hypothetical protein
MLQGPRVSRPAAAARPSGPSTADTRPSTIDHRQRLWDRARKIAAAPFAIFLKIKKNWKRARLPTSRHPGEPHRDAPGEFAMRLFCWFPSRPGVRPSINPASSSVAPGTCDRPRASSLPCLSLLAILILAHRCHDRKQRIPLTVIERRRTTRVRAPTTPTSDHPQRLWGPRCAIEILICSMTVCYRSSRSTMSGCCACY